jgi:methionine-rich copper-binding protein CopC
VDECRRLADGGKDEILAIEEREQKRSGIASLKVRYNRVFGYYIEITKSHLARVPDDYVRKQTIANGERYVTPELAELEKKVLAAEETLARREAELMRDEIAAVVAVAREISAAGAAIAVLDQSGDEVVGGELQVVDETMSRTYDPASFSPGVYTISYQAVSADGHPISGELTFMVHGEGESLAPLPTVSSGNGTDARPVVVVSLAILLAAGLGAALLIVRRMVATPDGTPSA